MQTEKNPFYKNRAFYLALVNILIALAFFNMAHDAGYSITTHGVRCSEGATSYSAGFDFCRTQNRSLALVYLIAGVSYFVFNYLNLMVIMKKGITGVWKQWHASDSNNTYVTMLVWQMVGFALVLSQVSFEPGIWINLIMRASMYHLASVALTILFNLLGGITGFDMWLAKVEAQHTNSVGWLHALGPIFAVLAYPLFF